MFEPGLSELVVGKNANTTYSGLTVGNTVDFGGGHWRVVGVFDAGGSAFDSEVWCDARVLDDVYKRPSNVFQSVTVHLTSPDALQQFKDSVTADPRLNVDVSREIDYYSKQSTRMTQLITILGGLVASVMAIAPSLARSTPCIPRLRNAAANRYHARLGIRGARGSIFVLD